MSNYRANKLASRTRNTDPTKTDQSQANDTDINVIVKRYKSSGVAPGAHSQPIYEDFSQLPRGLRDMLDAVKSLPMLRKQLPQPLAEMPMEELLSLTPDKLTSILTPPAPEPAKEPK